MNTEKSIDEDVFLTLSEDGAGLVERSLSEITESSHEGENSRTQSSAASDRRKKTRHPAHWPLLGTLNNNKQFVAMTENVSENGLLIRTEYRLKQGERAYLRIESFTGGIRQLIDAIVEFKHVSLARDQYRCGAEIIKISPANQNFMMFYASGVNPHKGVELSSVASFNA